MSGYATRLTTERLILRPFRNSDAADVLEYASDPEFRRFTPYIPDDYSLSDASSYIERCMNADWGVEPTFAAEFEGRVIGSITVRLEAGDVVAIGYGIGRSYWGLGFATEAVSAVISWAISSLGGKLVYASADVENPGSIRVMQKLGMVDVIGDGKPTFPNRKAEVRYEITSVEWLDNHPDVK